MSVLGGTDVLADVLDTLKLRGRIFCRCELSAPWSLGFAAGEFSHFHIVARGRCCFRLAGATETTEIEQGDLLWVPRGHGYQISDSATTPPIPIEELISQGDGGLRAVITHGGGGTAAEIICGSFQFLGPDARAFLAGLPEWIRVTTTQGGASEWLDATVRLISVEARQPGLGTETIVGRMIDVLFVQAIRAWLADHPQGAGGWLGALKDPAIGATLGLMHKSPDRAWTVPMLAAEAGMSRSAFAARFTALVGMPPLSYLQRWRLQMAADLLRTQSLPITAIAERSGYESVEAFGRSFKREFGLSPAVFRRRAKASS